MRIRSFKQHDCTAKAFALLAAVAVFCGSLALTATARAQDCPPPGATCPRSGTHVGIDFEAFTAGTPVEGLGAVHPDLAITSSAGLAPACVPGSAHIIENGNGAFASYGTGTSTPNGCLSGAKGFGDNTGCSLDYEFTFSAGTTVSCFSIRMVDFGDLFPYGVLNHNVSLDAYAGATLVDTDAMLVVGPVQLLSGDACTAQAGDPGNHVFRVTGIGITRVTLTFDASPDPNVGFDDIQFCKDGLPVPVTPEAWGLVKSLYRTR
jgi:hypothetical protein